MRVVLCAWLCWMMMQVFGPACGRAESVCELVSEQPQADELATICVETRDATSDQMIPVRAIVTDAKGQHLDGAGRGLYEDGRFFADGSFTVTAQPGEVRMKIVHGPNYMPLEFTLVAKARTVTQVVAKLDPWFVPEDRGWYAGDNHVHAQHDRDAVIKTDLSYTALQARAAGLSFVTEAGSNISYSDMQKLETANFILRQANEIRPGPYVGHLNTPGIESPIPAETYESLVRRPLPAQAVYEAVRQRGGVVTQTHPMTPVHQLHWMGAAEAYSDAVLGRCADLFDVDAKHTQQLWFAMLNLGNRIGVSSYTDSALGRVSTLSPGDRRIYCRAAAFDYPSLVDAMRHAHTMATNGGPVFVFLSADGHGPGDVVSGNHRAMQVELEVRSLHPLRELELYQDGRRVAAFDVQGQSGTLERNYHAELPSDRSSWLVARAEDEGGKWCLTSPVFFSPPAAEESDASALAWTILLEVSNATRFVQLRPAYFAHVIVSLRPMDQLAQIQLLRNGEAIHTFRPDASYIRTHESIPVTQIDGEYAPGWVFYPDIESPVHFQADWPITLSGWYAVRVSTVKGQEFASDELLYEAGNPASHALSAAKLVGPDTRLALWGYGEDVPLAELTPPYEHGEWWYPRRTYWRLVSQFGDDRTELGTPVPQAGGRFRELD